MTTTWQSGLASDFGKELSEPSAAAHEPLRQLHLVKIDDIEFYFYELTDALRKLEAEPEASFEHVTVH